MKAPMPPDLKVIQERFEAQAADALETMIEKTEAEAPVKVTGIEVELIDQGAPEGPAVEVSVSVQPVKPRRSG